MLRPAFQQKVTVAYGGIIGRAENREMVQSLRLPFSHVRHLSFKKYRRFALVDTQPRSGNNQLPPRIVPDVVIDHHPVRQTTQTGPFFDIRPKYGATATILAEYMLAAGIQPTHAVATALIYAIRSETQDFAREYTGPDKAIHDLFFPQANHRLLARIQSPRLPLTYFGNLHDALENLESVDSLIVSHLGSRRAAGHRAGDRGPAPAPGRQDLVALHRLLQRPPLPLDPHHQHPGRRGLADEPPGRAARQGRRPRHDGRGLDRPEQGPGGGGAPQAAAQLAVRLARELKKKPEKLTRIELRAGARPPRIDRRLSVVRPRLRPDRSPARADGPHRTGSRRRRP